MLLIVMHLCHKACCYCTIDKFIKYMKYINLGRETIGMAFDLGITAVWQLWLPQSDRWQSNFQHLNHFKSNFLFWLRVFNLVYTHLQILSFWNKIFSCCIFLLLLELLLMIPQPPPMNTNKHLRLYLFPWLFYLYWNYTSKCKMFPGRTILPLLSQTLHILTTQLLSVSSTLVSIPGLIIRPKQQNCRISFPVKTSLSPLFARFTI